MIRTTSQNVIDVGDWDDLVEEVYNRPYDFQQQDGCKDRQQVYIKIPDRPNDFKNDTVPENNRRIRGVSFSAWLARDPEQRLDTGDIAYLEDGEDGWYSRQLWWCRNFYPDVQMVANDLYSKGLIDSGEYYIDINE